MSEGFEYLLEINEKTDEKALKEICKTSAERRPGQIKALAVLFLAVGALMLASGLALEDLKLFMPLCLMMLTLSLVYFLIINSLRKRIKKIFIDNGELENVRTLRFSREQLEASTVRGRSVFEFSEIKQIYETRDILYIRFKNNAIIPVIMRFVGEEQYKILTSIFAAYEAQHPIKHRVVKAPVPSPQPETLEPQQGVELKQGELPLAGAAFELSAEQTDRATRRADRLVKSGLFSTVFTLALLVAAGTQIYFGEYAAATGCFALAVLFAVLALYRHSFIKKNNRKVLSGALALELFDERMILTMPRSTLYLRYDEIKLAERGDEFVIFVTKQRSFFPVPSSALEQNPRALELLEEKLGGKLKTAK